MIEIKWEAPPSDGRGHRASDDWRAVAEQLRSKPGEWALIHLNAPGGWITSVNQGRLAAFGPSGSFQATSRPVPDSNPPRFKVWARYIGEQS